VKRSELAHILRAAAEIAEDGGILVVGSQAILASMSEDDLPERATMSMEADLAFLDDAAADKSDRVDGAIGEGSRFHRRFGYYAQGVDMNTATLPEGWQERAVRFRHGDYGDANAICPEIHDLVASKLVAGRDKDVDYARALVRSGLVDTDVLSQRVDLLPVLPGPRRRILALVDTLE